jgi:hypothetical protein
MFRELIEKYNYVAITNCNASTIQKLLFSEEIYWDYNYTEEDITKKNPHAEYEKNNKNNVVYYLINDFLYTGRYGFEKSEKIKRANIKGWDKMNTFIQTEYEGKVIDWKVLERKIKLNKLK